MTLQELRYIVALADTGHFGQAAEACHITQSTLSTQVKKLEDYLGLTLFDRSLKRITPTPVGRAILDSARVIVAEAERIRELARTVAEDVMAVTLHLGVIPTVGPYYLPHALVSVHKVFPRLKLVLREELTDRLLHKLREGRFDAALLALPVEDEGLEVFPLYREPFLVALPAGHPLAARDQIRPRELADAPLLLLEEGHCLREQALDVCGRADRPAEDVQATSLEMLRQMVAMDLGLTLLPQLAAENAPRGEKRLIALRPFAPPVPTRTIGLVWRRRSQRVETLARLAQHLATALPPGVQPAGRRERKR
ncbi:MAG: hydrogen peroxide-inducible genes activator [Burkholderiales bacterium]